MRYVHASLIALVLFGCVSADQPVASVSDKQSLQGALDKIPASVWELVDAAPERWVAGDKAQLIGHGTTFTGELDRLMGVAGTFSGQSGESVVRASKFLSAYSDAVDEGGNPELGVGALAQGLKLTGRYSTMVADDSWTVPGSILWSKVRRIALRDNWEPDEIKRLRGFESKGKSSSIYDAQFRLSQIVLSARLGAAESGALPADLAELKKFGWSEAVDPYSGKSFGYDPVRGVAWSVGPDGVDDGGKNYPEQWGKDAKDFVVRLK